MFLQTNNKIALLPCPTNWIAGEKNSSSNDPIPVIRKWMSNTSQKLSLIPIEIPQNNSIILRYSPLLLSQNPSPILHFVINSADFLVLHHSAHVIKQTFSPPFRALAMAAASKARKNHKSRKSLIYVGLLFFFVCSGRRRHLLIEARKIHSSDFSPRLAPVI